MSIDIRKLTSVKIRTSRRQPGDFRSRAAACRFSRHAATGL